MTVAIICYSIATALLGLAVVLLSIYSRRLWNIQHEINESLLINYLEERDDTP